MNQAIPLRNRVPGRDPRAPAPGKCPQTRVRTACFRRGAPDACIAAVPTRSGVMFLCRIAPRGRFRMGMRSIARSNAGHGDKDNMAAPHPRPGIRPLPGPRHGVRFRTLHRRSGPSGGRPSDAAPDTIASSCADGCRSAPASSGSPPAPGASATPQPDRRVPRPLRACRPPPRESRGTAGSRRLVAGCWITSSGFRNASGKSGDPGDAMLAGRGTEAEHKRKMCCTTMQRSFSISE